MKGDKEMRPLIEMLEQERTISQKQEGILRFMDRGIDHETFIILTNRMFKLDEEMSKLRDEMKEYFERLLG